MSKYKYQIELPSQEDLFDSKSHERTARAVLATLKQKNGIDLIGLEGELGSGKSTVIELIKQLSGAEGYKFVEFDVEKFQHGATKKALIETIHAAIEGEIDNPESRGKVTKAKNVALGNHFEYTSTVNSNVSIWVIWFGFSLLVASQVLLLALNGVMQFVAFAYQSIISAQLAPYSFDFQALASLFLLWLPWHIVRSAQNKKPVLWFFGTPPSTGDIFKRNSSDKISETIEINREVGSYELQEALSVFVSELPQGSQFILIIDNLDRVTSEKLREVWSDIEIFTSIAHDKIQLVLPYSRSHIASALVGKREIGREFISKRIPVTFRVSPIVSADWKIRCEKMISDSLGSISQQESQAIVQLISQWSAYEEKQITPRYLKRLVNAVVSMMILDTENSRLIAAFFYQLAHQDSDIPIDEILSRQYSGGEEAAREYQQLLERSWEITERIVDFETWSKNIVSIHFQTEIQIAESELLRAPLEQALENADGQTFINKRNIYAYSKILNEILAESGTENFIRVVSDVLALDNSDSREWIKDWLPAIDQCIKAEDKSVRNFKEWIEAHKKIQKLGVKIAVQDVEREFERKSATGMAGEVAELRDLYDMSSIIDKIPVAVTQFEAHRYVHALWPNRDIFPNWKIDRISPNEEQTKEIFDVFITDEKTDPSLLRRISEAYRLGWMIGSKPLEALVPSLIDKERLNTEGAIVEENIYAKDWYAQDQVNYYVNSLAGTQDGPEKVSLLAQSIANMVYHGSFQNLPQLEPHVQINDEFNRLLANYLAISCDVAKVLKACLTPNVNQIVSGALKVLIEQRRISRLEITAIITQYQPLAEAVGLDNDALIGWLKPWFASSSKKLSDLLSVNHAFLKAVFGTSDPNQFQEHFLRLLSSNEVSDEWWLQQISSPNSNVQFIFDFFYAQGGRKFESSSQLTKALKYFFSPENEDVLKSYDNPIWIDTILATLTTTSLDPLTRVVGMELNKTNGSFDTQASIIRNYGNRALLVPPVDREGQSHALTLFENALVDKITGTWFDVQQYAFPLWDADLLQQFVTKLVEYEQEGYAFDQLKSDATIETILKSRTEEKNDKDAEE